MVLVTKAKDLTNKILLRKPTHVLTPETMAPARKYIVDYWPKLTRYHPKDDGSLIGLPNSYLVPSYNKDNEFDYDELFYWDSYFMVQGMLDEEHKDFVMGILDDLIAEFKRFKIIPNSSQTYMTSRSQPPFLTSFIFDVFDTYHPGKKWLKEHIDVAKEEYQTVWMGTRKPHARQIYDGLSRYYDFNYLHDIAELESGWDMTTRFGRKALNYLPVDLNSLLYKYEMDFARAAEILGKNHEVYKWRAAAHRRRERIDGLMWSQLKGMYYDYNYIKKQRGSVESLAAYYTMWAGLADEKKAAKLVSNLKLFEEKGGLTATDAPQIGQFVPGAIPSQWAHPNGWAPLHFIVVKGLQRYGYHQEAQRIAMKWLKTNLDWYQDHGIFLEKYNVVQPDKPPAKGVYPAQTGFGWTNAVFERFCQEYIDKEA
jgi:alpha,alpha-trehalase